jgi:predicted nucleic acid-binding protein
MAVVVRGQVVVCGGPREIGEKRDALAVWLTRDPPLRFERCVLPVNEGVALAGGDLMGDAKRAGRGMSSMDGLIAVNAIAHDLTLATHNKDFKGFGIALVDSWLD